MKDDTLIISPTKRRNAFSKKEMEHAIKSLIKSNTTTQFLNKINEEDILTGQSQKNDNIPLSESRENSKLSMLSKNKTLSEEEKKLKEIWEYEKLLLDFNIIDFGSK